MWSSVANYFRGGGDEATPEVVQRNVRDSYKRLREGPTVAPLRAKKKRDSLKVEKNSLYVEEDMIDALYDVLVKQVPIRKAAHGRYGVKFGTLKSRANEVAVALGYDRFTSILLEERFDIAREDLRHFAGARVAGRPLLFTESQEAILAAYIFRLAPDGLAHHEANFRVVARRVWSMLNADAAEAGRVPLISRQFVVDFTRRNPSVARREGSALDIARRAGEANIKPFFELLEKIMKHRDPDLIGNIDEAMLSVKPSHVKVICASFQQVAHYCGVESEKPHLSVVPLVTASGEKLALMLIEGGAESTIAHAPWDRPTCEAFTCTETGFIDRPSYEEFVKDYAIPSINAHRRKLKKVGKPFYLFLDGHSSHDSNLADKLLWENKIHVIQFPSHVSHRCQPVDRGLFHVLKSKLADLLLTHLRSNNSLTVAARVELFYRAWDSIGPEVIVASFAHAGICPLDVTSAMKEGVLGDHAVAAICELQHVTKEFFVPDTLTLNPTYSLMTVTKVSRGRNKDGEISDRDVKTTAAIYFGQRFEEEVKMVRDAHISVAMEAKLRVKPKPVKLKSGKVKELESSERRKHHTHCGGHTEGEEEGRVDFPLQRTHF